MKINLFILYFFFATTYANASFKSYDLVLPNLKRQNGISKVAVKIWKDSVVKADILYFHGHADQAANHNRLFTDLSGKGFRVIGFDLPQHGDSKLGSLDLYSFDDLLKIAAAVEKDNFESARPLYLMGWSFGGFLLLKGLKSKEFLNALSRTPAGFMALSPAVQGKMLVGQDGWVRLSTLTQNEDLVAVAKPKPTTIFATPVFAARYLIESLILKSQSADYKIRHLILFSDPKLDYYVDITDSKNWFNKTENTQRQVFNCNEAYHALDFEPIAIYQEVEDQILSFLENRKSQVRTPRFCKNQVVK